MMLWCNHVNSFLQLDLLKQWINWYCLQYNCVYYCIILYGNILYYNIIAFSPFCLQTWFWIRIRITELEDLIRRRNSCCIIWWQCKSLLYKLIYITFHTIRYIICFIFTQIILKSFQFMFENRRKKIACYTYNCWNIITVMNIHCIVFAVTVIQCVKDSQEIILPHWVAKTMFSFFCFYVMLECL